MYPCQIVTWTWRQVGYVLGAIQTGWKHCQPGAIHNGTPLDLHSLSRSYTRHLQCLLHLLPPSEPRSRSGFSMETKFRLSHSWCTHVKLEPGHGARLAMFSARFKESSWKHCQPGAIHNGTLALLNGTCILFPEMRPVFEQKSWEPRSYKGHIQCLLHLLEPSKPRSCSGSPWKNKFRAVHKVVYSSKFAFHVLSYQQQCQPVPADMVAISLKAHFYGKILEGSCSTL